MATSSCRPCTPYSRNFQISVKRLVEAMLRVRPIRVDRLMI